jgi:DNA-binding NtrC family response regulator
MSPRTSGDDCRNIVVADEDKVIAGLVIETLLHDGHAVFHAYDGLSATQLALGLKVCDLVISNTRVGGVDGLDLIHELRERLRRLRSSTLPTGGGPRSSWRRSCPGTCPCCVSPFTAEELRAAVHSLLQ